MVSRELIHRPQRRVAEASAEIEWVKAVLSGVRKILIQSLDMVNGVAIHRVEAAD